MASIFNYKVFNKAGAYIASCKHVEDAAAIISAHGDGASIRYGHSKSKMLWLEGMESQSAGESYDFVAQTAEARLNNWFPGTVDKEAQDRTDLALEQTRATVRRMLAELPK